MVLLWLSVTDDELTCRAASGKLRANLEPQLLRMLAHPKSKRFFEDFAGQWLRTRNVLLTPVMSQPAARAGLKAVLVQESWVDWHDPLYDKVGNIQLSRILGADVRLVDAGFGIGFKQAWEDAVAEIERVANAAARMRRRRRGPKGVWPRSCPKAMASVRSSFRFRARASVRAIWETSSVWVRRVT